jgi:hypothetical protein
MNQLNENADAARREQIAATAKALRSRELPFLDGVRQLNVLGHEVSQTGHDEDFIVFTVIESETDHMPKSSVRAICAQSWIDQCDNEIREVEEFYGKRVDSACTRLIERFSKSA